MTKDTMKTIEPLSLILIHGGDVSGEAGGGRGGRGGGMIMARGNGKGSSTARVRGVWMRVGREGGILDQVMMMRRRRSRVDDGDGGGTTGLAP